MGEFNIEERLEEYGTAIDNMKWYINHYHIGELELWFAGMLNSWFELLESDVEHYTKTSKALSKFENNLTELKNIFHKYCSERNIKYDLTKKTR